MVTAPRGIRVSTDRKALTVDWPDGTSNEFPAEMLRVFSPSAEVQGHTPDQRKIQAGKREVMILSVKPVGNYAVRIGFDDMHDSGLYTWTFFADLANAKEKRWAAYLDELDQKGLSR
ncbi:gamma-butyrobetaine hydroxylase-like domain-containing protein [Notoacmeibacter ruber]|uniref:DUF971 domain-containing protein n=1 Tax=Notoacmeibacter ruber TaxID=2670375 RepID=A0A3L7JBT4_9HYPH|nr:DUF971 domain-containing protein [Notoacmeibacter ruber]RLQ88096.1 DUF971 domain-containing protein [Notoacmeibacter ruber]